jgi:hypothetical protein
MDQLSYDEWREKFVPLENRHENVCGAFDGTLFETFGTQLQQVMSEDVAHVWTLLEGDEGQWIAPGFRRVNRMGYFVCREPWNPNDQPPDVPVSRRSVIRSTSTLAGLADW